MSATSHSASTLDVLLTVTMTSGRRPRQNKEVFLGGIDDYSSSSEDLLVSIRFKLHDCILFKGLLMNSKLGCGHVLVLVIRK
jgi:hypothetical protein